MMYIDYINDNEKVNFNNIHILNKPQTLLEESLEEGQIAFREFEQIPKTVFEKFCQFVSIFSEVCLVDAVIELVLFSLVFIAFCLQKSKKRQNEDIPRSNIPRNQNRRSTNPNHEIDSLNSESNH